MEKGKRKYPLQFKVFDLTSSTRGQGKRSGGMVRGAMSAKISVSTTIDMKKTFKLDNQDDVEELEGLDTFDFSIYRNARKDGNNHYDAMCIVDKQEAKKEIFKHG